MIAVKSMPADNNEGIMVLEEWNKDIKLKQKLINVWVHVYGVPYEIRSFLPLWAVGSIIGATKKVVVRLLVVLDLKSILEDAEIVVDDGLYDIYFKVDKDQHDAEEFDDADDLNDDEEDQQEDVKWRMLIGTTILPSAEGSAPHKQHSNNLKTLPSTSAAPPCQEVVWLADKWANG